MKKLLILFFLFLPIITTAKQQKVWIDADTANEVDDIYAILRLLTEPDIYVVGLSSAHFNTPDMLVYEKWNQYDALGISTIDLSHELNKEILKKMGRSDVICCKGSDRQIGYAWGGFEPRKSEATDSLIKYVRSMPQGEILDIIGLGAFTNIASALMIAPDIASKIRCYIIGSQYDSQNGIWNKNEFNVRNDLSSFDYLLENSSLDLTIMPINPILPFTFKRQETLDKLSQKTVTHELLRERWIETDKSNNDRILWDLALVEVYLNPDFATKELRIVPPENGNRKVKVYIDVYLEKLYKEFWENIANK